MTKFILILFLLVPLTAHADKWRVGTIIGSEHYHGDFNQDQTPSIYGCYRETCLGKYQNSFYKESVFLFQQVATYHWKNLEIGLVFGAVSGYQDELTENKYLPFGGVTVKYKILKGWQIGPVTAYGLETTSVDWYNWKNEH